MVWWLLAANAQRNEVKKCAPQGGGIAPLTAHVKNDHLQAFSGLIFVAE